MHVQGIQLPLTYDGLLQHAQTSANLSMDTDKTTLQQLVLSHNGILAPTPHLPLVLCCNRIPKLEGDTCTRTWHLQMMRLCSTRFCSKQHNSV